jgi:hypothetical protein
VQNGYELAEVHDVLLTTPANNDLLVYELSTDLWKNKSASTLGIATTGDIPAFATNAQAQAGTSTTTVMSPASAYWADKRSGHSFVQFNSIAAATSGTGAAAFTIVGSFTVSSPTTAVGHGVGSFSFPAAQRGINRGNGSWNWAKRFTATFRYARNGFASDVNAISRVTFGKTVAVGDPTVNSVGIRMSGATALQLIVHNGTTFTAVTTTSNIVPSVPITIDIRIVSDGAGNVSLFVNDVLEATTALGPTGTSGTASASYFHTEAQNTAIITGNAVQHSIYNLHFEFAD